MKIGLFDSGLGGLSILRATTQLLPQYDYLFYGDTAHLPYGDRSESEIYELTRAGIRWLFERDTKIAIIACNTASAETARRLQQEFLPTEYPDRKILGVIVPTIEELQYSTPTSATLLATKRSVESGKFLLEIEQKGIRNVKLSQIATPELVPQIERGEVVAAAKAAATAIQTHTPKTQTIILGCTHYTKLKRELHTQFPDKTILSQDEIIPRKLATYLARHPEIVEKLTRTRDRTIHLTAHRPDYDEQIRFFLN